MTGLRASTRHRSGAVHFNMTPLIDIVFQLIIFFMLVSQFAGVENVPVDLPTLSQGDAEVLQPEDKVVVTLRYAEGLGHPIYQIGPLAVRTLDQLATRLARVKAISPDVELVLRTDKRIAYRYLRQVMLTASRLGIRTVQIAVAVGQSGTP